jgi:hypothetical protein
MSRLPQRSVLLSLNPPSLQLQRYRHGQRIAQLRRVPSLKSALVHSQVSKMFTLPVIFLHAEQAPQPQQPPARQLPRLLPPRSRPPHRPQPPPGLLPRRLVPARHQTMLWWAMELELQAVVPAVVLRSHPVLPWRVPLKTVVSFRSLASWMAVTFSMS